MALIKKPYELTFQPKIKALIYGEPGTGKTTLALSAPNPLLIDCDGGLHRVNYGHLKDAVQVASYDDILALFNEDLSEYETIIFDTGGKLLDFMAGYIIKNNPKAGMRNGTLSLKGYGERKQEFSALCKRVSQLDKHIIFVAHQKTTEENEIKRYVPLFGGSNYDDLVTELDLVGYVKMIGNNRTITFNPTEKNDGKNTCNLPPEINIALSVDEKGNALKNEFFSQVIDAYTARIRKNQEEGIKYNNIIRTFAEGVEKATTAEDLDRLLADILNTEHIGTSAEKTKMMLFNKSKQLGFAYNTELKRFAV